MFSQPNPTSVLRASCSSGTQQVQQNDLKIHAPAKTAADYRHSPSFRDPGDSLLNSMATNAPQQKR
jgi:hypothetical protein